jgi:predicted dehydrogenase
MTTTSKASASAVQRRAFLRGLAAASAFPFLAPRASAAESRGKAPPIPASERINVACCGIGNRGGAVVNSIAGTGLANIVALCDTDMGAKHTQAVLTKFPDVPRFKDFRQMLDKMGKGIDAVTVGVPDFSHFPICMLAMSMGKHVYVEKPMARTFQEVDLMMRAEKKYKVAAQMGNQGHSGGNYFQFKAWVEAGIIRNVTKITAFMNGARRWHGWTVTGLPPAEPIPETLDWDTWLATAQPHDYNSKYVNGDWRSWYDFGNGALGDWGAHILDTAHQFLELGLPEEVAAVKLDGPNDFIFPQASTLSFKFPARGAKPPVEITWYDGVRNLPPLPNDLGELPVDGDIPPPASGSVKQKGPGPGKVIYGEGLTFKGGSHSATLEIVPKSKMKDMESKLPKTPSGNSDHFKNFMLACKGQETCRSSFEIAGPLSQIFVLGVLAQRLNARLAFDRATHRITNHKLANDLLAGPPPRKGWEQFYKLA